LCLSPSIPPQNEIGLRGGKEIGDMLSSPDLRLKKLNVSWNSIRGHGAAVMCKALATNRCMQAACRAAKLRQFCLALQHCGNVAHCKIVTISRRFLQKFDASWNSLGDYSALELGNSLSCNKTLLQLNLTSCGLHDVAAVCGCCLFVVFCLLCVVCCLLFVGVAYFAAVDCTRAFCSSALAATAPEVFFHKLPLTLHLTA